MCKKNQQRCKKNRVFLIYFKIFELAFFCFKLQTFSWFSTHEICFRKKKPILQRWQLAGALFCKWGGDQCTPSSWSNFGFVNGRSFLELPILHTNNLLRLSPSKSNSNYLIFRFLGFLNLRRSFLLPLQ